MIYPLWVFEEDSKVFAIHRNSIKPIETIEKSDRGVMRWLSMCVYSEIEFRSKGRIFRVSKDDLGLSMQARWTLEQVLMDYDYRLLPIRLL